MKTDNRPQHTLLDELDTRQNDVIAQLDNLNHRIEMLLKDCAGSPKPHAEAVATGR